MKIYILQQHYTSSMQRESYIHGVFTSQEACTKPATKAKLRVIQEFGAHVVSCTRIEVNIYETDIKTDSNTGFVGRLSVGANADLWDMEFANQFKP